ncbi:MAG: 50S ribosomal protein L32 [Firmicutes bacterium]|nr:50S ribosomal protein L32 [Bacillota bacterium]
MGVPKRRVSKARKNKRRAMWKISGPTVVLCPHCHEPKMAHRICPECGYYRGKAVLEK